MGIRIVDIDAPEPSDTLDTFVFNSSFVNNEEIFMNYDLYLEDFGSIGDLTVTMYYDSLTATPTKLIDLISPIGFDRYRYGKINRSEALDSDRDLTLNLNATFVYGSECKETIGSDYVISSSNEASYERSLFRQSRRSYQEDGSLIYEDQVGFDNIHYLSDGDTWDEDAGEITVSAGDTNTTIYYFDGEKGGPIYSEGSALGTNQNFWRPFDGLKRSPNSRSNSATRFQVTYSQNRDVFDIDRNNSRSITVDYKNETTISSLFNLMDGKSFDLDLSQIDYGLFGTNIDTDSVVEVFRRNGVYSSSELFFKKLYGFRVEGIDYPYITWNNSDFRFEVSVMLNKGEINADFFTNVAPGYIALEKYNPTVTRTLLDSRNFDLDYIANPEDINGSLYNNSTWNLVGESKKSNFSLDKEEQTFYKFRILAERGINTIDPITGNEIEVRQPVSARYRKTTFFYDENGLLDSTVTETISTNLLQVSEGFVSSEQDDIFPLRGIRVDIDSLQILDVLGNFLSNSAFFLTKQRKPYAYTIENDILHQKHKYIKRVIQTDVTDNSYSGAGVNADIYRKRRQYNKQLRFHQGNSRKVTTIVEEPDRYERVKFKTIDYGSSNRKFPYDGTISPLPENEFDNSVTNTDFGIEYGEYFDTTSPTHTVESREITIGSDGWGLWGSNSVFLNAYLEDGIKVYLGYLIWKS